MSPASRLRGRPENCFACCCFVGDSLVSIGGGLLPCPSSAALLAALLSKNEVKSFLLEILDIISRHRPLMSAGFTLMRSQQSRLCSMHCDVQFWEDPIETIPNCERIAEHAASISAQLKRPSWMLELSYTTCQYVCAFGIPPSARARSSFQLPNAWHKLTQPKQLKCMRSS